MKRVLTAVILIPIVLGLVFFTSRFQWVFALAVAGVAALAGWEIMGLAERGGAKPPRVAVIVATVTLFAGNFAWPEGTNLIFGALCLHLLPTDRTGHGG